MDSFSQQLLALRRRQMQILLSILCLQRCVIGGPLVAPAGLQANERQAQHVLQHQTSQSQNAADTDAATPRRLHGRFLHITDIHPDEHYRVHSSTNEVSACHRGQGPAGPFGAETSDCDTPHSLMNATFDWIDKNLKDQIDFVVWTGDSARHDSDNKIARTAAEVRRSNKLVAHKFIETFSYPNNKSLSIPIVPNIGNNDILPHNVLKPGPNRWLKWYSKLWRRFIPEEQRPAFEFGGWFYTEVVPNRLAVFSLNTLYLFDRNGAVDDCALATEPGFKQMEWLRVQLQFLRERGVKAILTGHIPPARTNSKQLWDETCWQKHTLWLRQFRDVIVGSIYGHMNIDHFLIHDAKEIYYHLDGIEVEDEDDADEDEDDEEMDDEEMDDEEMDDDTLVRETMDTELDMMASSDYLLELRKRWTKLPKPEKFRTSIQAGSAEDDEDEDPEESSALSKGGRKKKKKGPKKPKLSKKYHERYQVSLVGPSVVPNYFPTLRVIEYNITGMEDTPVWQDGPPVLEDNPRLELHSLEDEDENEYEDGAFETEGRRKRRKHKNKKKRRKKKMPEFTVPDPPSKTAGPGPAYSPQPLTLTGYTQYFANLTHINNFVHEKDETASSGWRGGKHEGKKPGKKPNKPRPFKYEVEYTTFKDKLYKLRDLTVGSYIELAYRMGQPTSEGRKTDVDEDEHEDEDDAGSWRSTLLKGKPKKGKKKKPHNKVWLHFLQNAFIRTVEPKKLKAISEEESPA